MKLVPSTMWSATLSLLIITSGFIIAGGGDAEPISQPDSIESPSTEAFDPWPTWTGNTIYHTFEELETELFQAAIDHPDILTLQSIGKTWQDRDIWAVKISDNPAIEEADEPEVYFNSNHHAREWLTIEIALYGIHFLTDNYGTNATVTDIVNNRQVWILPCINPDGRVIDGDVLGDDPANHHPGTGGNGWRKNARDNDGDDVFDTIGDGVDLNRNYGFLWGASGASSGMDHETYGGPGPFSEPESQAVRDFARQHDFVYAVSYHTYSQLILYPWGWAYQQAPDNDALIGVANAMHDEITNLAGSAHDDYVVTKSSGLYPTAGNDGDWLYGELGTFAYCVEAFPYYDWGSGGPENHPSIQAPYDIFHPDSYQVLPVCQDNLGAIILLCQAADNKFQFIDHVSSEPVEAEIRIEDASSDSITINITDDGQRADVFDLAHTTIPGWTISLDTTTMSLVRNETQSTILNITVPFGQAPGTYTIWVNTSSQTNSTCTDSSAITVIVPWPNDIEGSAIFPFTEMGDFPMSQYNIDGAVKNIGEAQVGTFNNELTISKIGVGSDVTLFDDDMESGMGNWVTMDHDLTYSSSSWQDVTSRSSSGTHSLWCGDGGVYTMDTCQSLMMAQPINLKGYTSATLEFMSFYYIQDYYDFLMVEASIDNGKSWDYVTRYDGLAPSWQLRSLDLADYLGSEEFQLRFRFTSDNDITSILFGFWLDDVIITAHNPGENIVYNQVIPTSGPMDVGVQETLSWNYDFTIPGTYKASLETLFPTDDNAANDVHDVMFIINGSRALPEFTGIQSLSNPGMGANMEITWGPALQINDPITYNVYRFDHSPSEVEVNSTAARWNGTTLSFLDSGTPGQTYYYVVRAVDDLAQEEYNMAIMSITPGLTVEHWSPAGMVTTETRFMRGVASEGSANGLTTYLLGNAQSTTSVRSSLTGNIGVVSTGFRAWVRNSAGTEAELTGGSAEAIVERSANGAGIQTTTWSCPQTSLSATDSVVIRIYQSLSTPPTNLKAEFTTEQLGASSLDAATWTMSYYTTRDNDYFWWGDTTYDSRIDGFAWSVASDPYAHNTLNWTGSSGVSYYNIYRSDTPTGPWTFLDSTALGTETYVDMNKGQEDSTYWWYEVRGVDGFGTEEIGVTEVKESEGLLHPIYHIDVSGYSTGDWAFISFPVVASGNIRTVLDDSNPDGDNGTFWDVAKWYNPQDAADPWKTYRVGAATNDLITIDNTMGVWLHLTASDGTLSTGMTGTYSAVPVNIDLYAGWNLVGYPTQVSELATDALFGTGATLVAEYVAGVPYISDEALGDVTMVEGEAYWVYVNTDTPWTVGA
ncbi:MAG: hypothetical protein KAR56_01290 [Thermoplasmata archaeon]|nr:hypothetical protein [Thermoplasmata archaeon]